MERRNVHSNIKHDSSHDILFQPDPTSTISMHEFISAAAAGAMRTVIKYLDDGGSILVADEVQPTYMTDITPLCTSSLYIAKAVILLTVWPDRFEQERFVRTARNDRIFIEERS